MQFGSVDYVKVWQAKGTYSNINWAPKEKEGVDEAATRMNVRSTIPTKEKDQQVDQEEEQQE